jgi:hypothetical protein
VALWRFEGRASTLGAMSTRRMGRRARAIVCVALVVLGAGVGCSTTPYRGIPAEADIPRLGGAGTTPAPAVDTTTQPTTTQPTTTQPATTQPPAGAVPAATVAGPSRTTVPPTTVPRPGGRLQGVGTTGVAIDLPDAFVDEPGTDVRTLFPGIADGLESGGLLKRPVLVAVRRDTAAAVAPSVTAFEVPVTGATAAGVLAALRAAVGDRASAGTPATEPSRIGEAAYLTYQWRTSVDGRSVDVTSEHYAYVRPGAVLVVVITTTVERSAADGRSFGTIIASLAPA